MQPFLACYLPVVLGAELVNGDANGSVSWLSTNSIRKPNIFTKKDEARLEKLEIAMDNVEDNLEELLQNMHVQYSIFDATSNAIKQEILRLQRS